MAHVFKWTRASASATGISSSNTYIKITIDKNSTTTAPIKDESKKINWSESGAGTLSSNISLHYNNAKGSGDVYVCYGTIDTKYSTISEDTKKIKIGTYDGSYHKVNISDEDAKYIANNEHPDYLAINCTSGTLKCDPKAAGSSIIMTFDIIDYKTNPKPPSNLWLSVRPLDPGVKSLQVFPGTYVWLGWNSGVDGITAIDGYKIYRSTNPTGPFTSITTFPLSNDATSCGVIANPQTGENYYYRVRVCSKGKEFPASDSTSQYTVQLKSRGSNYTALNLRIGGTLNTAVPNRTTMYLGDEGRPSKLYLKWDDVTNISQNPIQKYQISLNGGSTWTDVSRNSSNQLVPYYQLATPTDDILSIKARVVGEHGASPQSNSVSIIQLKPPTTFAIKTLPSGQELSTDNNIITSDTIITWDALNLAGASVNYTIKCGFYELGYKQTTVTAVVPFSYVQSYTNVTVTANFQTDYNNEGGTWKVEKSVPFSRPSPMAAPVITQLYDGNAADTPTPIPANYIKTQCYDSLTVSWGQVKSPTDLNVSYDLDYKINDDGWISLLSKSTALTYTITLAKQRYKTDAYVYFRITAKDSNTSSMTITNPVRVLSLPTFLSTPQITCDRKNQSTIQFKYKKDMGQDKFIYTYQVRQTELSDNNEFVRLEKDEKDSFQLTDASLDSISETFGLPIALNASDASSNSLGIGLYNLITQGYGCPSGELKITLARSNFPHCNTIIYKNFNFQFRRAITTAASFNTYKQIGDETIKGAVSEFNPNTICRFIINDESRGDHKDALGEDTDKNKDFTYSYTITGNGLIDQPITEDYYDCILPISNNVQTQLTYKLTTIVTYKDKVTVSKSEDVILTLYRWTPQDYTTLTVTGNDIGFSGSINFPSGFYASQGLSNLDSITVEFYISGETEPRLTQVYEKEQLLKAISYDFSYKFKVTEVQTKNYGIYAKITPLNTDGNNSYVNTTPTALVRFEVVDMALRKNRLGVNIDEKFGIPGDKTTGALTVFNRPDKPEYPIVQISNSNSEASFIQLIDSEGNVVSDFKNSNDMLTISNLTKIINTNIVANSETTNYTIQSNYITADTIQQILPGTDITAEQYKTLAAMMLVGTGQKSKQCTLTAFGTLPAEDTPIPIILLVRGG